MKRSLAGLGLGALLVLGLATGLATSGLAASSDPLNQGDPDKVLTVSSGYVCTGPVTPLEKLEVGGDVRTVTVTASQPIVQVTIKSGEKAALVGATWTADYRSGTITITQGWSNYVVWVCTGSTTTTTDTTPATTETTPTTTETISTTTETTQATTETIPTTTTGPTTSETRPRVPLAPLTPPATPTPRPAREVAPAQAAPVRPAAPLTPPGSVAATQGGPTLACTP